MATSSAAPIIEAERARAALAAAWDADPSDALSVARFYRDCPGAVLAADLEAFHASPERQRWTRALAHVAAHEDVSTVVDIGCGAGHDLISLHDQVPGLRLFGVEPNTDLREALTAHFRVCCDERTWGVVADAAFAPIESADLLACFDVLEHVVDPEAFCAAIAGRAKVGALLLETTATADCGTPLHLEANRGWHPGRALRRAGWECIDESGRLRAWKRFRTEANARLPIVLCAGREIGVRTYDSVLRLLDTRTEAYDWRPGRASESGLLRARSVWASKWYREYCDDGFLMVDADIEFEPEDAEKVVRLGREKRSIAVAAYPVRDGGHLAIRGLRDEIAFGPDELPVEIRLGGTGFMYVHRDVVEAMVATLPLCHATQPWALWPMFDFEVVPSEVVPGDHEWLSEDWWFCERARQLGFGVWLDPTVTLTHWGHAPVTVKNMQAVSALNRGLLSVVKEA